MSSHTTSKQASQPPASQPTQRKPQPATMSRLALLVVACLLALGVVSTVSTPDQADSSPLDPFLREITAPIPYAFPDEDAEWNPACRQPLTALTFLPCVHQTQWSVLFFHAHCTSKPICEGVREYHKCVCVCVCACVRACVCVCGVCSPRNQLPHQGTTVPTDLLAYTR
jgi:hypothetical protein